MFELLVFTALAFAALAFLYWRDASREGFSSYKIFDSFFIILIGALLGGKLLFRNLSLDYFRYQMTYSPLILEGVLTGGAIAAYFYIKKSKWDGWKIGDMISPALAMFQAVLFLGFWLSTKRADLFLTALAFIALYSIIRTLKNKYRFGRSAEYFLLKRADKSIFTGGLLAVYLTGSSLIAILFLVAHFNISSWFWVFQVFFYFGILLATYHLTRRKLHFEGLKLPSIKYVKQIFRSN